MDDVKIKNIVKKLLALLLAACVILTTTAAASVDGRTVLTLGCVMSNWMLTERVAAFNSANPDYRIEIKSYFEKDTMVQDTVEAFDLDVMSGDVPDILCLDELHYETLRDAGVLADLRTWIDGENGLDRDAYLSDILTAGAGPSDPVWSIVPTVTVSAFCGSAADWGGWEDFTWERYLDRVGRSSLASEGTHSIPLPLRESSISVPSFFLSPHDPLRWARAGAPIG